ncbi:MAG: large conductance mechanosensitive channel protein MscL [Clostridia bacterium]|nr:large conductance mechanosensitive channel protein MscL [Clostridia bacterium]
MKKFFEEFKKFITRGNVLDMSVGVIVGGAFTGIVNGLSNNILKPLINWLLAILLGDNGLESAITMLSPAYVKDANGLPTTTYDLANSIYIDWGAFISAIINFLIIAIVLFCIVKFINKINGDYNDILKETKEMFSKEVIELRKQGKKTKEIKKILKERKEQALLEATENAKKAEEEAKKNAPPTTEELLSQILLELKNK